MATAPVSALQKKARPPSDRTVEKAWKKLEAEDKQEVIDWFSAEAEYLGTFLLASLSIK